MRTVVYDYQIFILQQYGGASRYFCEIAAHLQKECGWRTRIVAPLHFNKYLAESSVATCGLYLPVPSARIRNLYAGVNMKVSPVLSMPTRADIVHQTYYSAERPASRARVVVTVLDMIHELFPQYFPKHDPTRFKREAVLAADHIVCISHRTAKDLRDIFNVPSQKITVTQLGFSPIFRQSDHSRDRPSARSIRPYLLYVGHRAGYKNFSKVLEAFAASKMLSDEFDLVAFGGGPLTADELHRVRDLRLRPGAIRQQSGDDAVLARVYSEARAFVYPSLYEGFGIPPLEAMASGCAVACSNTSSIPEVVGAAGEYFDPTQMESVRTALETLAFSDARRDALINAGRIQSRRFSWSKCAEETAVAYETALGGSRI